MNAALRLGGKLRRSRQTGREKRKEGDRQSDVCWRGNEREISPSPCTPPLLFLFQRRGGGGSLAAAAPCDAQAGGAPGGLPVTPGPSCHVCGLGRGGESVRQEKPSALEPRRRTRTARAPGTGCL